MRNNFKSQIMPQRDVKKLLEEIGRLYDFDTTTLFDSYYFFLNEKNQKIYISSVNPLNLNIDRINSFGLYFGTIHNGKFRLSIDGSKFILPKSNFAILKKENLNKYLSGVDLDIADFEGINNKDKACFLIVLCDKENIGCVNIKEKTVFNYIPKSRRIEEGKLF